MPFSIIRVIHPSVQLSLSHPPPPPPRPTTPIHPFIIHSSIHSSSFHLSQPPTVTRLIYCVGLTCVSWASINPSLPPSIYPSIHLPHQSIPPGSPRRGWASIHPSVRPSTHQSVPPGPYLHSWAWSRVRRQQSHWWVSGRTRSPCWWPGLAPGSLSAWTTEEETTEVVLGSRNTHNTNNNSANAVHGEIIDCFR